MRHVSVTSVVLLTSTDAVVSTVDVSVRDKVTSGVYVSTCDSVLVGGGVMVCVSVDVSPLVAADSEEVMLPESVMSEVFVWVIEGSNMLSDAVLVIVIDSVSSFVAVIDPS